MIAPERVSTRAHGTYVKYVLEGCRCKDCRRAKRDYEQGRRRRKAYGGKWWGWVDAEPAREHVLALMSSRYQGANDGIGLKRIGKLAGVPHGSISKLVYGGPGDRPPSRKIKLETERKLLAVRPLDENLAGGAVVEAAPVWRMIDELVAFGVPRARIAEAMGKRPNLQLSRRWVKAFNARIVADLHWHLFEEAPKFRVSCSCNPTYDVLERIEAQGDDHRPRVPHHDWTYPDAHRAMVVASRATGKRDGCVVTREVEADSVAVRWYPGAEYVPAGVVVLKVLEGGEWR